jgi:predicted metal-binding membrane protein
MVAAMMLPVNLPVFHALSGDGGGPPAAFLAGYCGVWLAFGAAVFVGDTGVYSLTHSWYWLHQNGWAVLAATLAIVGIFQSTPAKRRYLERCRHGTDYATSSPNGWRALAWGLRYGGCELLCCWALMLLVIAVGHGLVWTLAFSGVMLAERALAQGELLARFTGAVVMVSCGAVVVANVF